MTEDPEIRAFRDRAAIAAMRVLLAAAMAENLDNALSNPDLVAHDAFRMAKAMAEERAFWGAE